MDYAQALEVVSRTVETAIDWQPSDTPAKRKSVVGQTAALHQAVMACSMPLLSCYVVLAACALARAEPRYWDATFRFLATTPCPICGMHITMVALIKAAGKHAGLDLLAIDHAADTYLSAYQIFKETTHA